MTLAVPPTAHPRREGGHDRQDHVLASVDTDLFRRPSLRRWSLRPAVAVLGDLLTAERKYACELVRTGVTGVLTALVERLYNCSSDT